MNRKRTLQFLFSFFIVYQIVYLAHAQPSKTARQGKAQVKEEVIFFDDFSESSIDRTKWTVLDEPSWIVNNEQQAYVDSSITIYTVKGAEAQGAEKGALVLHPRYSPGFVNKHGKKFDFLSGRMDTKGKFEFTYGKASARMKLPEGAGLWPAFWMLGSGKWPDTGEIDIMENVGETDWTSVALHGQGYSGDTPLADRYYFKPGSDATGWHVYSVEWSPEELIFKVDDDLVYKVAKPMVVHFGAWAFDNPKFLILNLALGGAFPVKINGIKEPYNGIPESTFKAIKDNKGKVFVDWVKVVKLQTEKK